MPTIPTMIQNALSKVYAESFFKAAQHVNITASIVLVTQTYINGLSGPSQLTIVKLEILMMTPIISIIFMFDETKPLIIEKFKSSPHYLIRLAD